LRCFSSRVNSVSCLVSPLVILKYLLLSTCLDVSQTTTSGVHGSRIGVSFADLQAVRWSWNVNPVELDVYVVNAIIAGHETDGVHVLIDGLDEAVVFRTGRRNHLQNTDHARTCQINKLSKSVNIIMPRMSTKIRNIKILNAF